MTVGQVATTARQATGGRRPEAPAAEPRTESRGFGRTLHERAALTDPQVDGAARLSGSAPLATAFDRGGLFGRAVAWDHDPAAPPLPEAEREPSASTTAADDMEVSGDARAALLDDPDAALVVRGARSPAAVLAEAAPEASSSAPGDAAATGKGPSGPVAPERAPQGRAREAAAPVLRPEARRGEQLRRQVVAQFAPVNVVVRAAQGIRVAARIGAARAGDAAEIEQALAVAVRDAGGELAELRLDGGIRRSGSCR
mgnify:CR=1 FL=1